MNTESVTQEHCGAQKLNEKVTQTFLLLQGFLLSIGNEMEVSNSVSDLLLVVQLSTNLLIDLMLVFLCLIYNNSYLALHESNMSLISCGS